ncbi:cytolethal distending toxin subunit B family protein [Campylobacter geochelonis]|uniref:Cytolethal distending toxin n=1 Tax=Campylobacter geochelonis TaxID=1780362 RepID=A0A128EJN5_9BACT|nr:cytolethal distending toxin subunit B family protein [Campylobacter geochelonis]QKF71230.1 cytolethal distending toxin, subunit CdtB [Campylobacter geochelonis]CZE49155.1 cytolethal distending toxin [Campylobacter geochelonis]CZE49313.1 cytolethal distending toxin [Campylobacter geochelonis]CZE51422.1 cytolethal distending toxin [Campylobacter geochelonis]
MKKVLIILFVGFNLLFANIEDYSIATWNMQGSSASTESKWNVNIRQLISGNGSADILLVQEAGSLPISAQYTGTIVQPVGVGIPIDEFAWNLGTASRPNLVYIYYSRVDVGANRVNLAIVSRRRADEVIVLPPPTVASRPIIGIRLGNDAFFSTHALANGGTDAPAIVENVYRYFTNRSNINWFIGGDFNRSPDSLSRALEPAVRARVNVIFPSGATQNSGGTLDYGVAGNSSQGSFVSPAIAAILMLANMRSQITSDHVPVNFRRF